MYRSNLIQNVDGKIYKYDKLFEGKKIEVLPSELVGYNYSPSSCLIRDTDGTIINLIDLILGNSSVGNGNPQEVIDARTDFWGKVHGNLNTRLNSDFQFVHIDNSKGMFLEKKGTGSLTVKNTLEGSIRNLKILGNTTGAYNPELSTSFPLQSVGQTENGMIVARTIGKNKCKTKTVIFDKSKNTTRFINIEIAGINLVKKYKLSSSSSDVHMYVTYFDNTQEAFTNSVLILFKKKIKLVQLYINKEIYESDTVITADNIQIEEGTISTSYEPYQESVAQVQLPSSMGGLKGIGSVQDEVDFNGNIVQKCDIAIITGSENFAVYKNNTDTIVCAADGILDNISNSNRMVVTNYLSHMESVIYDKEGWGFGDKTSRFYISINKSKLATPDLAGFIHY